MLVRYLGPRESVGVGGYGSHARGEIKDYPEQTALELVSTGRRQRFELVAEPPAAPEPSTKPKRKRRIKP